MGLTDRLTAPFRPNSYGRNAVIPAPLPGVDNLWPWINYGGHTYPMNGFQQTIRGNVEEIDGSFAGLVQGAYQSNGVVFACMLARMQLFTEARFQFQQMKGGRPGKLWGDAALDILEHPWPNGVTGDLLARAITDADIAGNFFATRRGGSIRRMRPDWVTIVLGSPNDPDVEAGDIDAEVLGYIYHPGGRYSGRDPEALLRSQVAHFAPIPDPLASFRGMSWLTPIIREIAADKAMTEHKSAYLANGGTPNIVISLDKDMRAAESPAAFAEWIELFKKQNPTNGWEKFKTMYLAGGTKMEVVGSTLQQIDFKSVQGAGETRIAAAAGVPPVIVGLSEGLQAATYSNYGQARRRFADNTMRPLWRNMAGSLQTIVPPPSGSRLWYDDRDIQALTEDKKDQAEVHQLEAQQIRTLTDAGFTPDSVIASVTAGDLSKLVHTGLFSVQLQPPMPDGPPKAEPVMPVPGRGYEELIAASESRMYQALERVATPAGLTIADGAFRFESPVTVHAPEPPVVNVTMPEPSVTFEDGAIRVESPDVTVNTPEVIVHTPDVTVEPQITVVVPDAPRSRRTVERDAAGQIVAIVEEPDGE